MKRWRSGTLQHGTDCSAKEPDSDAAGRGLDLDGDFIADEGLLLVREATEEARRDCGDRRLPELTPHLRDTTKQAWTAGCMVSALLGARGP